MNNKITNLICKMMVVFLSLFFIFSSIYVTKTHADDFIEVNNATDLIDALSRGKNIKLNADISGGPFLVANGTEITIDLNGYEINRNISLQSINGNIIQVLGNLTIIDTSSNQTGKITGGWNSNGFGGAVDVARGATFTLAGGSITENVVSISNGLGGGVFVDEDATFIMTGGEISYCSAGSDGTSSNGHGGAVAVYGRFEMTGGYIYKCGILNSKTSSTAYGGAVYVAEGGTFVLDGGILGENKNGDKLGNQANKQGGSVYIESNQNQYNVGDENKFEFINGKIVSSSASGGAGAVYNGDVFTMTSNDAVIEKTISSNSTITLGNGSTFTMNGGDIRDNESVGVIVEKGATFNLTAGAIRNNIGSFGGGVRVNGGTFNMNGGVIKDNSAVYAGGGVYISPYNSSYNLEDGGVFILSSGNITNNMVTGYNDNGSLGNGNGGGVWIGKGSFNMLGGYIVNNKSSLLSYSAGHTDDHASLGGGVWVSNDATFTVSGSPAIQSNNVGGSDFISNVKLDTNASITIDNGLNKAQIGVTPFLDTPAQWGANAVGAYVFKQGSDDNIFSSDEVSESILSNFNSDVEDYKVVRHSGDNYAQLFYHSHNITYTVADNGYELIAECNLCGENATLTLATLDNAKDDSSSKAWFDYAGLIAFNELTMKNVSDSNIEYYQGETRLAAMPTEVGTYIAKFTLTDNSTDYTIEKEFNIDHDWGEWVITHEPTIDEPGNKQRSCKNCHEKQNEAIPKVPSVEIIIVATTIDNAVIADNYTFRAARGFSISDIYNDSTLKSEIISHFSVRKDYGYLPYNNPSKNLGIEIITKELSEFNSWAEVNRNADDCDDTEINENTTLYLPIAKTVNEIEFSSEIPLCGTEVIYDDNGTNTKNQPVLKPSENGQVINSMEAKYPRYVDTNNDPIQSLTIIGGDNYTVYSLAYPAYGYQFHKDTTPTIVVENAKENTARIVEYSLSPDYPEYVGFKFDIVAEHDFETEGVVTREPTLESEGIMTYKCRHYDTCHGSRNESIPRLEPVTITFKGSSIDGDNIFNDYVIKIPKGSKLSELSSDIQDQIIARFTNENYKPANDLIFVSSKPLSELENWPDLYEEDQENYEKQLNENTTFYLALCKPIDTIDITIDKLICGKEVKLEIDDVISYENQPQVRVNNDSVEVYEDRGMPGAVIIKYPERDTYFNGTIKGGQNYYIYVSLRSKFGYQFDFENQPSNISVENANEETIEVDSDPSAVYFILKFEVTAVHDYDNPIYQWADDDSTVTAKRICKGDESHEEETVNTKSAIIKEATETEDGQKIIVAEFKNPAFETQIKTVIIPATGGDKVYYVMTFNPSGGLINGSSNPVYISYVKGEKITIIDAPIRQGYRFLYWEGSIYYPGDEYEVIDNHTFTAKWEKINSEPYNIPKTGIDNNH